MIEKFFIICLAIILFGFGAIMTIADIGKVIHHQTDAPLK